VRRGLPISDYWTFFAKCYGWGATSEYRFKIGDFAPTAPGSQTQNCRFSSKMALCLKKVCYKVSLYKNCQRYDLCICIHGLLFRFMLFSLLIIVLLLSFWSRRIKLNIEINLKGIFGLYIRAIMIGGGRPVLYVKMWRWLTHPIAKRRFSIYFRS